MNKLQKSQQAEVSEVFSSLQGEGPYLGVRQIFVRFGRCNMHCGYCDEIDKMKPERFTLYNRKRLTDEILRQAKEQGRPHSISLTGGEPLFYAPFLERWLPQLKRRGFWIYLETNGTLPRELDKVIRWCDIIAMDMKPPSSTGDRAFWKAHESFLKIAARREMFVKVVITAKTKIEEVMRCVDIVASVDAAIPFIFQPESEALGISVKALQLIEKEMLEPAQRSLSNVRVIPQLHKIWGVR